MVSSRFFKLFPPPGYLTMQPVGIDISDQSVKYARLVFNHSGLVIDALGERALPGGLIERGQILDKQKLQNELRALKEEINSEYVYVALPEEQAYVVKLQLPNIKASELRQSIELQLEEHVPLPASGVLFDYEVVREPQHEKDSFDLAVSVFPKQTVGDYLEVFSGAGITPLAFEVEAQAVVRSLVKRGDDHTTLVVDFGKTRSGFFVAAGKRVMLTSTIDQVGGELLTKAAQKNLGITYQEAEQLKTTRGLLQSADNKLLYALLPIVSVLRDEVNKFHNYWDTHTDNPHRDHKKIEKIILCGGQSTLPGLIEYLDASLDVPVELGNVWTNILDSNRVVPPLPLNQAVRYATALGLALRPFYHLPL